MLDKYGREYVSLYNECQCMRKLANKTEMSFESHVALDPYEKWVLYFVGYIDPLSN